VKFCNGVLFPKDRGRGTGRNRRTEITFGRVEILERRSIWPSRGVSRIEK